MSDLNREADAPVIRQIVYVLLGFVVFTAALGASLNAIFY